MTDKAAGIFGSIAIPRCGAHDNQCVSFHTCFRWWWVGPCSFYEFLAFEMIAFHYVCGLEECRRGCLPIIADGGGKFLGDVFGIASGGAVEDGHLHCRLAGMR